MNREQLGQYWRCVVEDRDTFWPDRSDKCKMCKEMSDIFAELHDSYFFYVIYVIYFIFLMLQIVRKKFLISLSYGEFLLV